MIQPDSEGTIDSKNASFNWTRKDLIGLEEISKDELLHILNTARGMQAISNRSIRKAPALRGRVAVLLFFEPSTRTRTSFQLAAERLSADTIEFTEKMSATRKGETLIDTAQNIEAMGVDIMIVRHAAPGSSQIIANNVDCCVVNAGRCSSV